MRGLLLAGGLTLLGLLLATLPLLSAAAIVLGTIAFCAVLVEPRVGLALLVLAVPFGSPFNVSLGGFNAGPSEMLFALTIAAWLGHKVIARELPSSPRREPRGLPIIVWPVAAFIFALALTLTVTHSLPASLKELLKWGEVLLVILFVNDVLERRHIPWLLSLVFAAAALEAGIGLFQTLRRAGPEPFFVPLGGQLVLRSYGTFEQPNPFAAFLNLSLPIMISLLLGVVAGGLVMSRRPAGERSLRVLFVTTLLAMPVISAAFFFSLSRGAWLGFAAAFVVMTAFRSRRALLVFVLFALVFVALLMLGSLNVLPPALAERIADIPTFLGLNLFDPRAVVLTNENFGIVDRMAHWFAAWNMFNDFPWLGVGIGNYGVVYAQYGLREWPLSLGHAHNIYLNMLAEAGIVGLTFYLLLVVSALLYAWRAAQRSDGFWRALALGILGVLVAMSVHNFFDNLYVHAMNLHFAILLGILGRIRNE